MRKGVKLKKYINCVTAFNIEFRSHENYIELGKKQPSP